MGIHPTDADGWAFVLSHYMGKVPSVLSAPVCCLLQKLFKDLGIYYRLRDLGKNQNFQY